MNVKIELIKRNFLKVLERVTFNNLKAHELIDINNKINEITKTLVELQESFSKPKLSNDKINKIDKQNMDK
jgi:hypothetical protein